jgi:predicted Zn-dependent protease
VSGRLAAFLVVALGVAGCGGVRAVPSHEPVRPTRFDYEAFLVAHPGIPEPNYLPFMAHRFELESGDDAVLFCRWEDDRFPLAVWVEPPQIEASLQNEFDPKEPGAFAEAAWRALEAWTEAFPDRTLFRRAASADEADLRIELVGAEGPAPEEGVQVLGLTPVFRSCRIKGGDPASGRFTVEYGVDALQIYMADQHGLLPIDQVERNALHEIGHALGMRGHSPIPADAMYEVARDRRVGRLSPEDVNSFRALYELPNGTLYARVPRSGWPERPPAAAPPGPPRLAPDPYVDEELGFSLRLPLGWSRIRAQRGVVVVDGLAWDYEASFQVIVRRYPSIESYLERYGGSHVGRGEVLAQRELTLAGHPAFQMRVSQHDGEMIEDHLFVETGDGRVVVVITDCPTALQEQFEPWFGAVLGSLEVRPAPRRAHRDRAG